MRGVAYVRNEKSISPSHMLVAVGIESSSWWARLNHYRRAICSHIARRAGLMRNLYLRFRPQPPERRLEYTLTSFPF